MWSATSQHSHPLSLFISFTISVSVSLSPSLCSIHPFNHPLSLLVIQTSFHPILFFLYHFFSQFLSIFLLSSLLSSLPVSILLSPLFLSLYFFFHSFLRNHPYLSIPSSISPSETLLLLPTYPFHPLLPPSLLLPYLPTYPLYPLPLPASPSLPSYHLSLLSPCHVYFDNRPILAHDIWLERAC